MWLMTTLYQAALAVEQDEALTAEMVKLEDAVISDGFDDHFDDIEAINQINY
jgi:hypothetical protein